MSENLEGDMESPKNEGERLPVEGTSDLSAKLGRCANCRDSENELVLQSAILESVEDALDGKEVSDFMESFPIVSKAKMVRFLAGPAA